MNIQEQLLRDEGRHVSAYQDSLGYWTIGVGRMIDSRKGGGLSDDEINYLLTNDIGKCRAQLMAKFWWFGSTDEARQGVIINMCFQLGIGGLSGFPKMLTAMAKADYATAAAEMLDSEWAKQTPERAGRLHQQMLTGVWQ